MRLFTLARLLAGALVTLSMLVTSASASYVTTFTGGSAWTPAIHAVNENGHVSLHNPEANIECEAEVEGWVESHGSGEVVKGSISDIGGESCTGGWEVVANSYGSATISHTTGHNGTLTSTGATVTATLNLVFFHVTCRYATSNTHIGVITGGNPATVHLEGNIPFHSGSGACGAGGSQLTGDAVTTSALYVAG
jgi:hypothetical protein